MNKRHVIRTTVMKYDERDILAEIHVDTCECAKYNYKVGEEVLLEDGQVGIILWFVDRNNAKVMLKHEFIPGLSGTVSVVTMPLRNSDGQWLRKVSDYANDSSETEGSGID